MDPIDNQIIYLYCSSNRNIKQIAGMLNISQIQVGKIVRKYNNIKKIPYHNYISK